MEAIIFVGLQGSGKTTFFKERFFDTHIRINLDMLRTRHREKLLFNACLEGKAKLVVDNTNTLIFERERYITSARNAQFKIVGYFFVPDVEGCLERNALRTAECAVPEKAILGTKKNFQYPGFSEGFDELYHVEISNEDKSFIVRKIENEV